jgi:hypothetical protein
MSDCWEFFNENIDNFLPLDKTDFSCGELKRIKGMKTKKYEYFVFYSEPLKGGMILRKKRKATNSLLPKRLAKNEKR